jgi:hypothetical protein
MNAVPAAQNKNIRNPEQYFLDTAKNGGQSALPTSADKRQKD